MSKSLIIDDKPLQLFPKLAAAVGANNSALARTVNDSDGMRTDAAGWLRRGSEGGR